MPTQLPSQVLQLFEVLRVLTDRVTGPSGSITPSEFLAGQRLAHLVIGAHRRGTVPQLATALVAADDELRSYRNGASA